MKTVPLSDPLLQYLEAAAPEFLKTEGFDVSPRAGCLAVLEWLRTAKVEAAFWNEGKIDNAADWFIGETRLDGMIRGVQALGVLFRMSSRMFCVPGSGGKGIHKVKPQKAHAISCFQIIA